MPLLITVWRIPLNADGEALAQLLALLSDDESSKAEQFKNDLHRQRYVVSHVAMRRILSRETECAPNELRFITSKFGKPSLDKPFEHVQFNLTHSADLALLAVCRDGAVGVDLEAQQSLIDLGGLVTKVCSPAEARLVINSADAEQLFYRCWVGKEAVLKCLGHGLSASTTSFAVMDAQGRLLSSPVVPPEWCDADAVKLHLLDKLPKGYVGAVSVLQKKNENSEFEVHMQDWEP